MLIRVGYEIAIRCNEPTPTTTYLNLESARISDIQCERGPTATPDVHIETFRDLFGNNCLRFLAPAGNLSLTYDAVVKDSGLTDPVEENATELSVDKLPVECLAYLTASRYCETDELSNLAWELFGQVPPGWRRVQAICDYVNQRLTFSYGFARATRTAAQAHEERVGVCRDFAHLAVAFCRCMNIPARYVNGYLGDIGVPADPAPMDFNAWFEVFLGGKWHTFDARHNQRRIGRIVVARGRDAADIPLIHTFGPHELTNFKVWTFEEQESSFARQRFEKVSLLTPWFSPRWSRLSRQIRERTEAGRTL
ncbi:transglutaminase-like domain-containing protein [Phyllobacterium lublinensis]|uniref:transglutaminase-like domain-containing protein n=1 Tax=Phyllobacterium lublinensis TaxID=2875708 RepID=UPI001CCC1172|nr:transglutaminase family protein [Phyllobacterium sp. 2063]MBZ9656209.1 transglutaminase family protein [Phyllobacterium sp. 2063]